MSLITFTVPGDIVGAITAGFNFGTAQANAVQAIAQDTSAPGLALKADLVALLAPVASILVKLDTLLGLHVNAVQTSTPDPTKPTPLPAGSQ